MPGNSGNKSNKTKLHVSTSSSRDTFNQALNEATTAEQARSGANSGEGHSAKSSNTNFADLKEWYDKLDYDTRSAMDKAADKPTSRFTNEERDNFYLKVDPYHYLQYLQYRYPGKTEFIQSRMHSYYGFRRHLEENGVAPKKPSEAKPETQYAEQAVKEQANKKESPKDKSIFDVVQDEIKAEKSPEDRATDKVWDEALGVNKPKSKPAESNTDQPVVNPEKVTPERQAAQDIVNFTLVGDSYSPSPNFRLRGKPYYSPTPVPYRRPPAKKTGFEPRMDLDNINLSTGHGMSPARYNSLSSILGRNEPMLMGLGAAGVLGLGGLGLYGKYKYGDVEQPQTQVPNQIEPEPVNEAVVQPEPTPEQQFVLQSTSPFDYAKIANLFDLYARYGSPDSIDNSISEEQPADENAPQSDSDAYKNAQEMGQRIASGTGYAPELKKDNFEFPQNPPKVGSNIKTAGLKSPDGGEVPQELNKLSGVKPRVVKDTSKGPVVLNDPNHRKTRDVQNNSVTPEQAAAKQMVNQYAGIPAEVVRAKKQPLLTTDAIWNRLRQKGLVSPEEGIRSGLFTPAEVRYITENDLWRYR